jgi:hypothetical protein
MSPFTKALNQKMICEMGISRSDGVLEWWSNDDWNDFRFWIVTFCLLTPVSCSFIVGISLLEIGKYP